MAKDKPLRSRSHALFERAKQIIPGGVNSPVRAFQAVKGEPVFFARGEGAFLFDADGFRYVDLVGSWGPLILGHRHPAVLEGLQEALQIGTSFGAPTELEVELASLILEGFPAMEMVRMVNSGTEATMTALRLARAYTRRDKILKFEGCYHGHNDSLLIKAGSGALTLGVPSSPGIPAGLLNSTLVTSYNDISSLEEVFSSAGEEIAAVIIEPVAANMGLVLPDKEFLQALRRITEEYQALLIFDEVISGFRIEYGGAQTFYGITPDLTCLGKIIGGGLPVGAIAGKREIMELLAPSGPVYQAGTLSGNPLAMAAGIATLKQLKAKKLYQELENCSSLLAQWFQEAAAAAGLTGRVCFNRLGSMLSCFFTPGPVIDYHTALKSDTSAYAAFFWEMLERGFYLAPSQFEAMFVSAAHTREVLEPVMEAAVHAFRRAGASYRG